MSERPSAIAEQPAVFEQSRTVKPRNRISEATKRAIVAEYLVSGSIYKTANKFEVHRNTVTTIVNSVRLLYSSAQFLPPLTNRLTRSQSGLERRGLQSRRGHVQ